jgi:4'-phosphopantetheinyl transferase EntD
VTDAERILAALASIAPSTVEVGARLIAAADVALLLPAEVRAVRTARGPRRDEFASGRVLLREVLGIECPIPVAADRRPVLPAGIEASLAHDDRFVVVAISRHGLHLGVDIEPVEPLAPDLHDVIVRADESIDDTHLAFSIKEAAYKAWSNAGGGMLEHHDVRLRLGPDDSFVALVVGADHEIRGSHTSAVGRRLALAWTDAGVPAGSAT